MINITGCRTFHQEKVSPPRIKMYHLSFHAKNRKILFLGTKFQMYFV